MASSLRVLRLHLQIRGRVQGVCYRESMRVEAERLGVHGWVSNCLDGSVEAVLEGDPIAVRLLERWCNKGPAGARVTSVKVQPEPPSNEKDFRVLR